MAKKSQSLTAKNADRHLLYERSVQCTEASIDLIDKIFHQEHRRKPLSLREDFCGTAKLCADWVRSDRRRTAVGIDNDRETLEWAERHNRRPLDAEAISRVSLVLSDVLTCEKKGFDVIAAFNFSYFIFKTREMVARYFRKAYDSLPSGGLFVMDLFGGPDSQFVMEEETKRAEFTYVWDQTYFDPISNHIICHIHYRFPDKSELTEAFTYDWRVWSIPELRDILTEIGFKKTTVWWDCDDDVIRPKKEVENLISWIAYVAAWK